MVGEPVKWRRNPRELITRSIPKSKYPDIVSLMIEDGLVCVLTSGGATWYSGRYVVTSVEVRKKWGMTRAQFARFVKRVYQHDAFGRYDYGDDS